MVILSSLRGRSSEDVIANILSTYRQWIGTLRSQCLSAIHSVPFPMTVSFSEVWGSFTDVHIVHKTARAVAEKLGYLALALAQAAAYMRSKSLNLFEYFRRLCEDISRIIGTRFPPYAEGVFSCWTLSIQALMEVNPDAITLLRFCSSLSPEGISPELLTRGLKALGWLDNGNLIPINLRG